MRHAARLLANDLHHRMRTQLLLVSMHRDHKVLGRPGHDRGDALVGAVLLVAGLARAGDDAGRLAIEASDGHVTLRGTVGSFYQKQMAQESLRAIDEIVTIDNELEVHWN